MTKVDFPEPVEPMKAVVCPGYAVKEILERTSSSALGYRKETFSNSTTPFLDGSVSFGETGSVMAGCFFSTSTIRLAETEALGSMIDTIEIIRKDMMICMVYCKNAIMSPTCICPASTPFAPNQTMAMEITFIISIIVGIMQVMTRLTKRLVFVKS